ncbi:MAG: GTP cyclohydrolase II [Alphaproteobacteria bacterium]|nr:GTP cyclohydrolase II [Alphaproteobacteria bacterium]MBV9693430.1 GTP cyclohydrolase II [Alphaproteobacteria bacterium]
MRGKVKSPTLGRDGPAIARVARAVDTLRRGEAVLIDGEQPMLALAVETAPDAALRTLDKPRLLITHARARTLKIRLYTPEIVALAIAPNAAMAELCAIADPARDLDTPLKGPFEALRDPLPDTAGAAVKLAKLAGLLPAVVVAQPAAKGAAAEIDAGAISSYEQEVVRSLTIVTRARVPLEGAENAEMVAFRAGDGAPEHYAIVIGAPPTHQPVLTRLHSECFTGDLLGSLKCDCGPQLRGATEAIAKAGAGILLYLAQEGRGIGLINKLRAYRLQDQGFDTMEANERLGFGADERLYGVAARMLQLLGYDSVRLMTNNPHKVAALESAGVTVSERVPHSFPAHAHNRAYLDTKRAKGGHLI